MADTLSYLIRKGSELDAPRIAGIQVKTWQAAYRGLMPDDYLDKLDALRREVVWKQLLSAPWETVFVVLREARIVGFCDVLPSRDGGAPAEVAEIAALYVEPEEWGKGAGRGLVAAAVEHARDHGFSSLTLWVLASNRRARTFYEQAGFRADGAEKTDSSPGFPLHEVRYRLSL